MVHMKSLADRDIPFSQHSDFGMAAFAANDTCLDCNQSHDITTYPGIAGSAGKTANFTILAENPFKVDPMHIKDIKIIGSVFRGAFNSAAAN